MIMIIIWSNVFDKNSQIPQVYLNTKRYIYLSVKWTACPPPPPPPHHLLELSDMDGISKSLPFAYKAENMFHWFCDV